MPNISLLYIFIEVLFQTRLPTAHSILGAKGGIRNLGLRYDALVRPDARFLMENPPYRRAVAAAFNDGRGNVNG
jgi:hypothetical protein